MTSRVAMPGGLRSFDMQGRSVLVTGAAGLLGIEHCVAVAEAGARVVMTDLRAEALQRAREKVLQSLPSADVRVLEMDVTDAASIGAAADVLAGQGIRVDVLINNAAIDPKVREGDVLEGSRLENFRLQDWNLQVAVGLTGAFLCSQRFGTLMARDGMGGVILNIASDLSVFSPDQRLYRREDRAEFDQPVKPVTYSVIKTGLIGLTRYLATYWADRGVRANALSPGGVFNGQGEEFVRRLSALIPQGRMARADEYRSAVQFLSSDASSYLNGQNIVIDGGRSAW